MLVGIGATSPDLSQYTGVSIDTSALTLSTPTAAQVAAASAAGQASSNPMFDPNNLPLLDAQQIAENTAIAATVPDLCNGFMCSGVTGELIAAIVAGVIFLGVMAGKR